MDWKNWKSSFAFFVFIGLYVYTIYDDRSVDIVDVSGDLALIITLFIMFRSKITTDLLGKLIDNIKIGK